MTAPPQPNFARSDLNAQDPLLKTRVFAVTREQAIDCLETTFKGEKGWHIDTVDRYKGTVRMDHKAGLFGPVNEVTVTCSQEQILNGKRTHLNVLSMPKGGKGTPEKAAISIKAFNKVVDLNIRAWTR
jgi:hypothetical protein